MTKKELTNPLVIIAVGLVIATVIAFVNYYFIVPLTKEKEKIEVSNSEKSELIILTSAYLNQNKNLLLNKYLSTKVDNNRYQVAAEYYYLEKGKEYLNEYDKILELAKQLFDDKYIDFANFEINIDNNRCGKEKYSTIDGINFYDNCDNVSLVYEIADIYKQEKNYIVEFYAAKASQTEIQSEKKCQNFEIPLNYKLTLTDLFDNKFYDEDYYSCCNYECALNGVEPLKKDIINQAKTRKNIYKMIFKKNDSNFIYYELKK